MGRGSSTANATDPFAAIMGSRRGRKYELPEDFASLTQFEFQSDMRHLLSLVAKGQLLLPLQALHQYSGEFGQFVQWNLPEKPATELVKGLLAHINRQLRDEWQQTMATLGADIKVSFPEPLEPFDIKLLQLLCSPEKDANFDFLDDLRWKGHQATHETLVGAFIGSLSPAFGSFSGVESLAQQLGIAPSDHHLYNIPHATMLKLFSAFVPTSPEPLDDAGYAKRLERLKTDLEEALRQAHFSRPTQTMGGPVTYHENLPSEHKKNSHLNHILNSDVTNNIYTDLMPERKRRRDELNSYIGREVLSLGSIDMEKEDIYRKKGGGIIQNTEKIRPFSEESIFQPQEDVFGGSSERFFSDSLDKSYS